jgi:pyridoxal phosphate enzyme (YggS family)
MTRTVSIKEELEIVKGQIAVAAGNRAKDIKIIAVTKTVPPEKIKEAIEAGLTDFGENRVQEALPKVKAFPQVNWHLIGHLQTNKVKEVMGKFKLIQSVDSERVVREIERRGTMDGGPRIKILIEVNTSGEESKYGVKPAELIPLLQLISGFGNISVAGLMTIAPIVADQEQARPYFAALRKLSLQVAQLHLPNVEMKYLSMGMSDDFLAAIKEGANLVRLGRAIFGKRS